MNAVMISIQPVWVEKILSGEKTIEVRKTKPKLQVPFKCYIYCTKSGGHYKHIYVNEKDARNKYGVANHWSKKQQIVEVNGSKANPNNFLAYECYLAEGEVVAEFTCDEIKPIFPADYTCLNNISFKSCLTNQRIAEYSNFKRIYGWRISDLMVYDKPKELSEFYTERVTTTYYPKITKMNRPPQSWCYVEGMGVTSGKSPI